MWFTDMLMFRKRYVLLKKLRFVVLALPHVLFLVYTLRAYSFSRNDDFDDFVSALTSRADSDRYIILAMTDEAFSDMAINFYEASLRMHRVDNFLFVGVGRKACEIMTTMSIPCFHYADDPSADRASSYGQRDFKRKMNIRTDMILEALAANFTVIHTDTDIAFLSNPLSEIKVIVYN